MAAKRFYAVKEGRTPGILGTWEECRASVDGYPGAEYKGFVDLSEAEAYLGGTSVPLSGGAAVSPEETAAPARKTAMDRKAASAPKRDGRGQRGKRSGGCSVRSPEDIPEPGTLLAYVDGSYDDSLKKYAFGCVFLLPDGRVYTEYGNGEKEQSLQHRNVTGEMLGAMYAVKTAMMNGFARIEIRYDYQGIEKWVTGEWRSRTELTRKYAQAMREWGKNITFCFTKVAAHTNVYYNELADKMAKTGLREGNGIPKVRKFEEMECTEKDHGIDTAE